MGSKTISLSDDAYERLRSAKRPGESFSDVVRRLVPQRSLTELGGIVPREKADELAEVIEENRRLRIEARRRKLGLDEDDDR